jgi:hypothetical protein
VVARGEKRNVEFWWGILEDGDCLEDRTMYGSIILKRILK